MDLNKMLNFKKFVIILGLALFFIHSYGFGQETPEFKRK